MVLPFMEHEPTPLPGIHFPSWRKFSAAISRESVEEPFGAFLGAFFYGLLSWTRTAGLGKS